MSNFEGLKAYNIPSDLLVKITNVYRMIGNSESLVQGLGDYKDVFQQNALYEDAYALAKFIKVDVSPERMRLIIVKNSTPRTNEEKKVQGILESLTLIRERSLKKEVLVSSDILDYLKMIYNKSLKFDTDNYKINNKERKSTRFIYNRMLDEFQKYVQTNDYEPIILSCIATMEMYNINPFMEQSYTGMLLMYYYLLLRSGAQPLYYVSFMNIYLNNKDKIDRTLQEGSVNYNQGVLFFNNFVSITYDLINKAFLELNEKAKGVKYEKQARKSQNIERAIMEEVPEIFSKEDIVKLYPQVSSSTIMRSLLKLQEKKYIMPLGKGRSAKWKRLIDINSPEYVFRDRLKEDEIDED